MIFNGHCTKYKLPLITHLFKYFKMSYFFLAIIFIFIIVREKSFKLKWPHATSKRLIHRSNG